MWGSPARDSESVDVGGGYRLSMTQLSRATRWAIAVSLVSGLISVVATAEVGAAIVRPIVPPHNPERNFRLALLDRVLASIDAARRSEEGLGPLVFDRTRLASLSVAQQVFVISNLERTSRGLYPAVAMMRRLDSVATSAAERDQDPVDNGRSYSSIWSSAPSSLGQAAYFADFGWMYDDGPPPQYIFRNVDCTHAGESGCWGHRDNILSNPLRGFRGCAGVLVTGTGYASRTNDGPSLTQIFEVSCANQVSGSAFTWRHAVSYLRIPAAEAGLSPRS